MLHPAALAALVVLALNDQLLKRIAPGFITGKLSDVAGLIVAPLALVAAWEVARWVARRWRGPSRRALVVATLAVGIGFAAIQLWAPATDAYRYGLGAAQWPFRALLAVIRRVPVPAAEPVLAVGDAEDLLALPALAITWWLGRRRLAQAG